MTPHFEAIARTRYAEFDLEYIEFAAIEDGKGPIRLRMTGFGDGDIPGGTWCEQLTARLTPELAEELIAALQTMVVFHISREMARVQPLLPLIQRRQAA